MSVGKTIVLSCSSILHIKLSFCTPIYIAIETCRVPSPVVLTLAFTTILGAAAGSRAMAGSKLHVMGASVCVFLVLAMMAIEPANAAGVCNANALWPCFNSIQGARPPPPSKQCCNVVKNVDKICMCNQFKASSFPKQMLQNGLQLPKKCGRFDLLGFKCGVYTFPY